MKGGNELDRLRAEVSVLRARLAKVEALADEWDERRRPGMIGISRRIRAALASVPDPYACTRPCMRRQCRGRIRHSGVIHWLGWMRD